MSGKGLRRGRDELAADNHGFCPASSASQIAISPARICSEESPPLMVIVREPFGPDPVTSAFSVSAQARRRRFTEVWAWV